MRFLLWNFQSGIWVNIRSFIWKHRVVKFLFADVMKDSLFWARKFIPMDDSASYDWLFMISYDVVAAKYREENHIFWRKKCTHLYFAKYNPTPDIYRPLNDVRKIFKNETKSSNVYCCRKFQFVKNPQVGLTCLWTAYCVWWPARFVGGDIKN